MFRFLQKENFSRSQKDDPFQEFPSSLLEMIHPLDLLSQLNCNELEVL